MAIIEGLHSRAIQLFVRGGGHPTPEVVKSWPLPNHINPEERGWGGPIALMVLMGLTFVIYFARMWARLSVGRNAGLDDVLMTLAMLPLAGLTISVILAIRKYGFQWHVWDQTAETRITSRKITMAIEMNYMICTTLVKVSILCFYRRITGALTNSFVYWVWGAIIFCVVYCVLFILLIAFNCTPAAGFFNLYNPVWVAQHEVHCRDEGALVVAATTISTVIDFMVGLLPVSLVWKIQISKRQKLALCGIFGVGVVTCVCGIMRTYYAIKVYYFSYDITWWGYHGWVWTSLEADLGVICASGPALKMFFLRYFRNPGSSYYNASGRKTPGIGSQTYPKGSHLHSARSVGKPRVVTGDSNDSDVPMTSIKVSQGLDILVEDNWDQKSDSSLRNLTLQHNATGKWPEGCRTVCEAWKPSSPDQSRSRSEDTDLESGPWSR
ncbi:hypothetical protein P153DRAFT_370646 [Dothidotthia symphoricarpi CBS 119687]|uniref:Rhodopsin domain-containing protein n=1 Tax=Dothidotthia symphoricarpi CBS 119687 TaxID=1392245 RepID=A0A6A5ZYA4_9PLEO|nr:uncharacterized protein P153DRAFT_370646 [Dothidotthia symphoricarpi CBS 119687]KAF2124732.1 hypothetical protein P153DRAFT_370646 [Dothidotthia symphoricarpi CBS 119687]